MAPVWTAVTGLPGQGVHSKSTVLKKKKEEGTILVLFLTSLEGIKAPTGI